jgi:ribosomal protein S18 acetylase RimI-like enzyme
VLRLVDRFDEQDIQEVFRITDECYPEDGYNQSELRSILMKYPAWFIEYVEVQACLISEVSKAQPYIWSVCTRPAHRGKGHATTLINVFEKHYSDNGYYKPWLQVRVENPAQKIYFDLGYRVSAFEANLYGAHQHGVVMRKSILK